MPRRGTQRHRLSQGGAIRRSRHVFPMISKDSGKPCSDPVVFFFLTHGNITVYMVFEGFPGVLFFLTDLGPNDLCLDPHGDIVFTDPTGSSIDNPIGSIYKIKTAKDGLAQKVIRLDNKLAFPNGLAFHPDGSKLYLAESGTNRLLSYSVDEEGLLSDKKIVMQFPTDTLDGISFDQFSNLWIARWTNGTIDVVDISSGSLTKSYKLGERVTNMCWLNGYIYVTIAGNGTIVRIPVWH